MTISYNDYLARVFATSDEEFSFVMARYEVPLTLSGASPFVGKDLGEIFHAEMENGVFDALLAEVGLLSSFGQEVLIDGEVLDIASFFAGSTNGGIYSNEGGFDPDVFRNQDTLEFNDVAFLHFARNILNNYTIEYTDVIQSGYEEYTWFPRSKAVFHVYNDFGLTDNENNFKVTKVLEGGSSEEYVFRYFGGQFYSVDDPRNAGSFNYVDASQSNLGHNALDIAPFTVFGNDVDDPSAVSQRGLLDGASISLPSLLSAATISRTDASETIDLGSIRYSVFANGGDDTIFSGTQHDTINGGSGNDFIDYSRSREGVAVNLDLGFAHGGDASRDDSNDEHEVLISIENAVGSGSGDILIGSSIANELYGSGGSDIIFGLSGADNLFGGSHDDFIVGGEGADTLHGDDGSDTLLGGEGADTLFGGSHDDFIVGGAGADYIDGGTERDTVDYSQSSSGITIDLGVGTGIGGDAEGDTIQNVEVVLGSDHSDELSGGAEAALLQGGAGNDILRSVMDGDTLDGGTGSDRFVLMSQSTMISEYERRGSDRDLIDVSHFVQGAFDSGQSAENLVRAANDGEGGVYLEVNRDGLDAAFGWERIADIEAFSALGVSLALRANSSSADAEIAVLSDPEAWRFDDHTSYFEERDGSFTFTITRPAAELAQTVYVSTLDVQASRGFVNDGDYEAMDHVPLTFAAGQNTATITLNIFDDDESEANHNVGIIVQENQTPIMGLYEEAHLAWTSIQIYDPPEAAANGAEAWGVEFDDVQSPGVLSGAIFAAGQTSLLLLDYSGFDGNAVGLSWDYNGDGRINLGMQNGTNQLSRFFHFDTIGLIGSEIGDWLDLHYLHRGFGAWLDAGDGDDRIIGSRYGDTIFGGAGDDTINGHLGDDAIYGGVGDDYVYDLSGGDTVFGGAGADDIFFERDVDEPTKTALVFGGDGDDRILVGAHIAVVDGGDGFDNAFVDNSASSVDTTIDLLEEGATVYLPNGSQLTSIEDLDYVGGSGSDTLLLGRPLGSYNLGAGEDRVTFDFSGMSAAAGLSGSFGTSGVRSVSYFGNGQFNAVSDVEYVRAIGSDFDDNLRAGEGGIEDVVIYGGKGDDVVRGDGLVNWLFGGEGNDYFRVENPEITTTISGGDGFDRLELGYDRTEGFEAQIDGSLSIAQSGEGTFSSGKLAASGINEFYLRTGEFDDKIDMTLDSRLWGLIDFGGGTDSVVMDVTGLAGNLRFRIDDEYSYSRLADTDDYSRGEIAGTRNAELFDVSLGAGNDSMDGGGNGDTLNAGAGNDTIRGEGGDDILDGQAGNDVIWGGDGVDRAVFSTPSNGIISVREFKITSIDHGRYLEVSTEQDGVDQIFEDVELLQFADATKTYADMLALVATPSIVGQLVENAILSIDLAGLPYDADNLAPGALSYQWYRDGVAIGSAIDGKYAVIATDIGTHLSVAVSRLQQSNLVEVLVSDEMPEIVAQVDANGTPNNDMLAGSKDADRIDGFAGDDLIFGSGSRDLLIGSDGDDYVYGDDFELRYALPEANQVFRLYQATFNRTPDEGGHKRWASDLFTGASTLADVREGFVGSQEFSRKYTNVDNATFVKQMYINVLDRDFDLGEVTQAEIDNWMNRITDTFTRADVVNGFAESQQLINNTLQAANKLAVESNPANWSDDVYRLYQATLDRAPDIGGFTAWSDLLSEGRPLEHVISGFTNSTEFANTYGVLTDPKDFVKLLYSNVLGRDSDLGEVSQSEITGWTEQLNETFTLANIVQGFSQSTEFTNKTAQDVKDWIRAQGVDDQVNGGSGINTLAGGSLADQFMFHQSDAATNTVLDLEAWDYLSFEGFGYTAESEALDHMSQAGNSVVFSDQGTQITFERFQLSDIADDMIIV